MHDIPLVDDATNEVDEKCNTKDDSKDTSRAQSAFLFRLGCATTRISRADFENVGAMIGRAKKRDGRTAGQARRGVADEGEEGGLSAIVSLAWDQVWI